MDNVGSAIIFFHEDYSRMPKDAPVATTFVEAVALNRLRPKDASVPLDENLEKTVCGVDVDGTVHRCLVLTVAKDKPLDKQLLFVYGEKKALQARAICWMKGLKLDVPAKAVVNTVPTPARSSNKETGTPKATSTVRQARPVNTATGTPSSSSVAVASQARPAISGSVASVVTAPSTSTVVAASATVSGSDTFTRPSARSATAASYRHPKGVPSKPLATKAPWKGSPSGTKAGKSSSDRLSERPGKPLATRKSRSPGMAVDTANRGWLPEKQPASRTPKRSASMAMGVGDSGSEASFDFDGQQKPQRPRHRKQRAVSRSAPKRAPSVVPPSARLSTAERNGGALEGHVGDQATSQTAMQLSLKAATTNSQQVAVALILHQLFSADELANGRLTQKALDNIQNKPEANTAILLDQEKLQLAKDAVAMWRRSKGNEEALADDNFKHQCRVVRVEVRKMVEALKA